MIVQAITIGIGFRRISADRQLYVIGQAIAIGVPGSIIGIIAAVGLIQQAIAVEIFLAIERRLA